MENTKHLGCMWALAVALGVGMGVASTPAVAWAAPGDNDKGSSSSSEPSSKKPTTKKGEASSSETKKPRTEERKRRGTDFRPVSSTVSVKIRPKPAVVSASAANRPPTAPVRPAALPLLQQIASIPSRMVNRSAAAVSTAAVDPGFISSTHGFFGLFSVTSAADPDDNDYVAFVLRTPFFTNVLTSGTDPEDNLGFGAASIGVAGHTVNTFISPLLNFSIGIPITDPFAPLFTALVRAGF